MTRIHELDRYPKLLLLTLLVMALVFAAVYGVVSSRVGFLYCDTILVPRQTDGATLYEGSIDGADSIFTVTADAVAFRRGSTEYGPYTVREDPAAIPQEDPLAPYMTGVTILDGQKILFRGGVMENSGGLMLFDEDGALEFRITATMSNGTMVDENGQIVDPYAPTAGTVLRLLQGPQLESKGDWTLYLVGLLLCAVTAVSILFADDLFYLRMSFRVQDAYAIEPSDWELTSRTIGWTIVVLVILWAFLYGLA